MSLEGTSFAFVTYYWRPYRSGLTLHVARIAEALAVRGADVRAVAARHDPALPARERIGGVEVERVRVRGRVNRALLAPGLLPAIRRAAGAVDVVAVATPIVEAALLGRAIRPHARFALLHVCDPQVPPGALNRTALATLDASTRIAVRRAELILALSEDYARHSRVLGPIADRIVGIPPPVEVGTAPAAAAAREPGPLPRVGFLGRLTHEKGLDVLIRAAARLSTPVQLILAGASDGVAGGGERERLEALSAELGVATVFPGPLPDRELPGFYAGLDVFALPSVSSLEAYGMVQAEAMLAGTPVVASALPGVRELVGRTGMGLTARPGDAPDLARALGEVLRRPEAFRRSRAEVRDRLGLDDVLDRYAAVLGALARKPANPGPAGQQR